MKIGLLLNKASNLKNVMMDQFHEVLDRKKLKMIHETQASSVSSVSGTFFHFYKYSIILIIFIGIRCR